MSQDGQSTSPADAAALGGTAATHAHGTGQGAFATPPVAPSVVAVVVTHNPGPWFEETLAALAAQDYPNLALLVLDAASATDPLARIAQVAPSAYVRRLSHNPGFAAACNRATRIVHGSSYLVFCHDDIAPAPDAIRRMVERSLRSNAGVVTPKYVEWDDPTRLVALGGSVDQTAAFAPGVEKGDRDQGQLDRAEEVFVAPGGMMLTRTDLFLTLGGFDGAMAYTGEDVDFSWRVQLAGARIFTEPNARVRHIEAASNDLRLLGSTIGTTDDESAMLDTPPPLLDELLLRRRHRLRTILKVRSRWGLFAAIAKLLVISFAEAVGGIVTGRGEHTAAVSSAWIWNIAHWRDLYKLRRNAQRARTVSDKKINSRLASTRQRVERLTREEYETRRAQFEADGGSIVGKLRRLPVVVWAIVLLVWFFGTRQLLGSQLPTIGTIVPLPDSPVESFQRFFGMLPTEPFGNATTRSPIELLIGILGFFSFGAMDVLRQILVLGMLPLGIWGIVRLVRPLRSTYAKLAAILAYLAVPIPYDALQMGRWSGLVCYALAPFVMVRMLRSLDAAPFRRPRRHIELDNARRRRLEDLEEWETVDVSRGALGADVKDGAAIANVQAAENSRAGDIANERESIVRAERVLPMALLFGVIALVIPQAIVAVLLVAIALAVGAVLTNDKDADAPRVLILTSVAAVLAVLLISPALLGADRGITRLWQSPMMSQMPVKLVEMLGFSIGAIPPSYFTLGILAAGLPALLFGRKWRYNLSVRMWCVLVMCVSVQWVATYIEWLRPNPSVFVTFAAVAAAMNVAVSALAVREDLSSYRFGWRHVFPVVAVLGIGCALLPIVPRMLNGTWGMPDVSNMELISALNGRGNAGAYRVLWLGSGDGLPGGGRSVESDLAMAITENENTALDLFIPRDGGKGQADIERAIKSLRRGETVAVGHLLAPYGIKFIAIPNRTSAYNTTGHGLSIPSGIDAVFDTQLDMRKIATDASLTVYENTQYLPTRARLTDAGVLAAGGEKRGLQSSQLAGATPALLPTSLASWEGNVDAGVLYVAEQRSQAWRAYRNGVPLERAPAFGWSSSFQVPSSGLVQLRYTATDWVVAVQVLNAIAWLFVLLVALRHFSSNGRWS